MIRKNNLLFRPHKTRDELPIDMAPLIDCVLQLLIYFLLASSFIFQPGFKVDMPSAQTFDSSKVAKIYCYVTKDNQIYLNDNKVDIVKFDEELKNLLAPLEDKVVTVNADKEVAYGLVITIIDKIHLAGGEGVNLSTLPIDLEQINIKK